MSIKVYGHEILDGIADRVRSQASIAYVSPAVPTEKINDIDLSDLIKKHNLALANSNPRQPDLFYLKSILVSTGWNLNDDVFLPEELWASRYTPEDKQFNFMHNDMDIIGHITSNTAVDLDGNALSEEATLPENFNILVDAVIYRSWSQIEQQERIDKIIAEILDGQWFVSMETTFGSFDYAVKDESGVMKVIERNEASAFLTKHLRAYGGTGQYNGFTVGRVLRNMVFAGKGLVDKPANPPSVILNNDEDNEKSTSALRENDMPVDQNKQIEELQAELQLSKATVESLSAYKTKVEALESVVTEKDAAIAAATTEINELKASVAKLQAAFDALTTEKTTLASQLEEIQLKAKAERRKNALTEAGVDAAELEETLASLESIDDAAFDRVVSVMKKKKPAEPTKEEDDDDSEALENVTEPTKATVTETEPTDNKGELRTAASKWFASSVLETTPKK
jgi:regulator of replication initiation timing